MGLKKEKNKQSKLLLKNDIVLFTIATFIFFIVVQLASLGFFGTKGIEVTTIRHEQTALIEENEMLRSKINELQSLTRVESIAREEFGMVEAENIEYVSSYDRVSTQINDSE